jgi:ATP/maltotriose-dependent transcriptional regulator MalT/DNA-binding SARP family transcriptional activator
MGESVSMVDARILAKTTLPQLNRTVLRPRLIRRCVAEKGFRVIVITGQAAQGKSTLAAALTRQPGPAAAWMHLDPSDGDPVNFFHLLVHAVKASQPDLDASAFLKNPAIALGREADAGRIAELAGTFVDAVVARAPVRIVMDGLDRLNMQRDTRMLIHRIIDRMVPPSCLVLVSRQTPPLQLESLRIRQELVSLSNDDLAFTTDEIGRFYKELFGLTLAPAQVSRIEAISDGWAGGLVLVWEALRHVPAEQRPAVIDNGLPAAMHGERLAYFSEAVFSGLDEATRRFLVQSAIFDTIEPAMMGRYLQNKEGTDVAAILDRLVGQNLFIHRLFDAHAGWGYRYNQLFRDYLLDKFRSTLAPDVQRALLTRAADLTWDAGNFESAIHFFLQAQAFEKAAAGIKKIAMGLSAQGRFTDLAGWIDMLPDTMIDDDAWLAFYRVMARRTSGGRKNIPALSQAVARFRADGDERGQLMALAWLIETAVFIGHPPSALSRWLEDAWTLLEQASGHRYYPFAKAVLWMQVAFGHLSGAVDLPKGLSACRNALLLAHTIGDDTLTVNATVIHVFGLTLTGEFAAAEKALAAIQHLVAAAYPEYRALQNIVRMELALSQGDLEGARRLLDANQADIDTFGLLFLYPIHVDLSGLLQIHRGHFNAVGRTVRHLKDVATLAANPLYKGLAFRLRALKAYHQGRFEHARRWGEQAVAVIHESLGACIHLFRCRLIAGMAAFHLDDLEGARLALESARDFFAAVASHLSLVEARLGLSLVYAAMGDRDAADRQVNAALDVARSHGYAMLPILAASDVVAACTPILVQDGGVHAGLARQFIGGHQDRARASTPEIVANSSPTHAIASDSARPRLDIRTLGGFEVRCRDGSVIPDARWAGLRQKLLLKAIIVNGCREIPKDILMEALWPDSNADAAFKRFKVTLHRLRKILEPDMDPGAGSSYIVLKDGLVSLNMECCRVDVNAFLAACDEIRQLKRDDDDDRLLQTCRRAVEIYGGDFLPEEPYLSWAETKRSALQAQFIAVLLEMAGILERHNEMEKAAGIYRRAIEVDPLTELAHQHLMRLLGRQGRYSAALQVYRDLEKRLAEELDTQPDPATTQMFTALVNTGKRLSG